MENRGKLAGGQAGELAGSLRVCRGELARGSGHVGESKQGAGKRGSKR